MSDMIEILKRIDVTEDWQSAKGLILLFAAALFLSVLTNNAFQSGTITALVFLFSMLIGMSQWFYSRIIPATKKGKAGVVISLRCGSNEDERSFRDEFIENLREQVASNDESNHLFQIIVVPNYYTTKILSASDAVKLRLKKKAHLIIFGKIKVGKIEGKTIHSLDINANIIHRKMEGESLTDFKSAIQQSWQKIYQIRDNEKDFRLSEITSQMVLLSTKYIIGIALLSFHNLNPAEKILKEVQSTVSHLTHNQNAPVVKKIRQSVPVYLNELYLAYASYFHRDWMNSRELSELQEMKKRLDQVTILPRRNAQYWILLAIFHVAYSNNYTEAKKSLLKISGKYRDGIWHCNLAFVYGANGEYRASINQYAQAKSKKVDPDIVSQLEYFLRWYASSKTDHYYYFVFFLLGLISGEIKNDYKEAIDNLEAFVDHLKMDNPAVARSGIRIAEEKIAGYRKEIKYSSV